MPGHASDDYGERLDLMTAEELEDHHADPSNDEVSIIPRRMYMEKLAMLPLAAGDARQRAEFLARKPALGLSRADIEGILARAADARVTASQRRRAFSLLRNQALQALVPCSGAATLDAVCAALLAELDAGAVAPLPAWYAWEPSNFGRGRRMGYFACDARSCWVTEDPERALFSCARCKKAKYCSKVRERHRPVDLTATESVLLNPPSSHHVGLPGGRLEGAAQAAVRRQERRRRRQRARGGNAQPPVGRRRRRG